MSGVSLLLNDARGIYIPQNFVEGFKIAGFDGLTLQESKAWQNVTAWAYHACKDGPENSDYWEAWQAILENAEFTDENGNNWSLYQDGDLFAICYEKMTEEEKQNFGFEE